MKSKLFIIFLFLFQFIFLTNTAFSQDKSFFKIRVSVSNFTILDKDLEKLKPIETIHEKISRVVTLKPRFILKTAESRNFLSQELITSDEIVSTGNTELSDIVISGSLNKLNKDIILNLRISETVKGTVIYSKQYFSKENELDKLYDQIKADFDVFIDTLTSDQIDIVDINQGTAELRIKSIPMGAKVALNGKEVGKTPVILRNALDQINEIQTWKESDAFIKSINIASEDDKIFELQSKGRFYNEPSVNFSKIKEDEFLFQIISKPKDLSDSKVRTRIEDFKYENRRFKFEIITEPENTQISLNDKVLGAAPIILNSLPEGNYKVKLNKRKMFFFKEYVDSSKNKNALVSLNLFRVGRTLISSTPSNAEILIDNEKIGITPKSVELPIGSHKLELLKDGFKEESYPISIKDDKTNEINIDLTSLRNADTSVTALPTALVDNVMGVSSYFLSLGQYSINDKNNIAYLYGGEINYGFKNILAINEYINIGLQLGAFYNNMGSITDETKFSDNKGFGIKTSFLNQNDFIPVSLAVGSYYSFNSVYGNKITAYIASTREFKGFSTHVSAHIRPWEVSGLNFNFSYNGFYRVKLGASVLINFSLLTNKVEESLTPLLGVYAGYNFF